MSIPLVGMAPPASAAIAAAAVADLITGDSQTFNAGLGSWTASAGTLTRDTSSSAWQNRYNASLKWVTNANGTHIDCTVPGTFKQGVAYDAVLFFGVEETDGSTDISYAFGLIGTDSAPGPNYGSGQMFEGTAAFPRQYHTLRVRWTPSATRTGVTIRLTHNGTSTMTAHIAWAGVQKAPVGSLGMQLMENPDKNPGYIGDRALLITPYSSDVVVGLHPRGQGVTPGGIRFSQFGYVNLSSDDDSWGIFGASARSPGSGWWSEHPPGDLANHGINFEVGTDYVGFNIAEKDSSTIQIFDDSGGAYNIELVDQGGFGWKSVGPRGSFYLNYASRGLNLITAAAAIANTETVVVSQSMPIGTMEAGTTFRIRAYGRLTSGGTAGTSTFRIRIGTTTLTGNIPASLAIANNASQTNAPFVLDALVTVRTAGATGSVIGNMEVNGGVTAAFTSAGDVSAISSTVVVDTTAVNLVELTYISGNAGTTATFENAVIEVVNF